MKQRFRHLRFRHEAKWRLHGAWQRRKLDAAMRFGFHHRLTGMTRVEFRRDLWLPAKFALRDRRRKRPNLAAERAWAVF